MRRLRKQIIPGRVTLGWDVSLILMYEVKQCVVTHVLIDDVMRDVSVNVHVLHSVYMTNESYLKFKQEPFELVYRNATVNQDNEEVHWAEVYSVNWTFIEQNLMVKK